MSSLKPSDRGTLRAVSGGLWVFQGFLGAVFGESLWAVSGISGGCFWGSLGAHSGMPRAHFGDLWGPFWGSLGSDGCCLVSHHTPPSLPSEGCGTDSSCEQEMLFV